MKISAFILLILFWWNVTHPDTIKPSAEGAETVFREVMGMDTRRRIQAIRLMDMLRRNPAYAKALGIEIIMQKVG